MKISIRGGHNFLATGASGLIDEVTEDRKVLNSTIKYLKMTDNEILDVTPNDCDRSSDLYYGVNMANKNNSDLFVSIHFNNAYEKYEGAIGTETLCNLNNAESIKVSKRITDNLVELGFKNRGVRNGLSPRKLYEIFRTNMNALIIEVCFVEATEDVKLYNKLGYDLIGKYIAEGIVGYKINSENKDNSLETIKYMTNQMKDISDQLNNLANKTNKLEDILKNFSNKYK